MFSIRKKRFWMIRALSAAALLQSFTQKGLGLLWLGEDAIHVRQQGHRLRESGCVGPRMSLRPSLACLSKSSASDGRRVEYVIPG